MYPENIVVTSIWKVGEDDEGNEHFCFKTVCEDEGEWVEKEGGRVKKEHVALQGGWAVVKKA